MRSLLYPLCLAAGCTLALHAQETPPEDLKPLAYNNPGLVVDLGVGLWAWPMPMDYDGDGDLDLLVACPDKPSNGVWYFENPTQDPKAKMPVFKKAVRLGPASQNMQVSFVDGKPRVLKPGEEYVDFKANGFSKTEKIYPKNNVHPRGLRGNFWRYVDWDGDKDMDILVGTDDWSNYVWDHAYDAQGRWKNGPLHGNVYVIENLDGQGKYAEPAMVKAGGAPIDVFGWPSPSYADFNRDGDLDLICGEFLDGFTYFANRGVGTGKPEFARGVRLNGNDGQPLKMDLEMITPMAIDWDADGDPDLICGDEDGRVAFIENLTEAAAPMPVFAQPRYFQQEADTLKFGALSSPHVIDWDQDGDEDIVAGNTAGYIGFFENLGAGEGGLPKWAAPVYMKVNGKPYRIMAGPNGSIQGPCEAKWGYTTVSAGDVGADGTLDIVLSSILGEPLIFAKGAAKDELQAPRPYQLASDAGAPSWFWWEQTSIAVGDKKTRPLITQWRCKPHLFDWKKDGVADLIMLDSKGYLALAPADKSGQLGFERIFIDEDNRPVQLNNRSCGRSGRAHLAITDWDGDGRTDFLVNSENATWYRNCEDRNGKAVLKRIGNLARRNVSGHNTSPSVCDFDKDGKPDLLLGSEDGRFYHAPHAACITFPADQLKARAANPPAKPRAPGLVKEEFIFDKAKFPSCHASTIIENSRGLVAAWFGGTKEGDKDVGIWTSYFDGGEWSAPIEVANGVQYAGHRHPCWNPVLFQTPGDQETLLFFKVGPNPSEWWGEVMVSYDRGRSWRERRRLPEQIDGPVKNKPELLSDGSLLSPSSTEWKDKGWQLHFERTRDMGKTWERIGPVNDPTPMGPIQPSILKHKDGKLQVLCRSKVGKLATSWSSDLGKTWSDVAATNLPNPNSGTDAVTLADGRHILIYNHTTRDSEPWRGRSQLNVAVSEDGVNWQAAMILEREAKAEFSYPAVIQTADGMVHITYTWKRQKIKHVMLNPRELELKPIETFEAP